MGRKFAAFPAELVDRHAVLGLVFRAVLLLDNPFDRQAVAVPARHIGRVLAEHLLRPVDDVLQDLVESGAEVNVAIGIGRAVVKDELLATPRGFAQPAIKIHLLPAREDHRLALRQIPAHREIGLGQEYGRTIIRRHREPLDERRKSGNVPDPQTRTGPVIRRIQA